MKESAAFGYYYTLGSNNSGKNIRIIVFSILHPRVALKNLIYGKKFIIIFSTISKG